MRPARKGPENGGRAPAPEPAAPPFNEAGPQGAGKRAISAPATGAGRSLQ